MLSMEDPETDPWGIHNSNYYSQHRKLLTFALWWIQKTKCWNMPSSDQLLKKFHLKLAWQKPEAIIHNVATKGVFFRLHSSRFGKDFAMFFINKTRETTAAKIRLCGKAFPSSSHVTHTTKQCCLTGKMNWSKETALQCQHTSIAKRMCSFDPLISIGLGVLDRNV